jgi:hypothetical protein
MVMGKEAAGRTRYLRTWRDIDNRTCNRLLAPTSITTLFFLTLLSFVSPGCQDLAFARLRGHHLRAVYGGHERRECACVRQGLALRSSIQVRKEQMAPFLILSQFSLDRGPSLQAFSVEFFLVFVVAGLLPPS